MSVPLLNTVNVRIDDDSTGGATAGNKLLTRFLYTRPRARYPPGSAGLHPADIAVISTSVKIWSEGRLSISLSDAAFHFRIAT